MFSRFRETAKEAKADRTAEKEQARAVEEYADSVQEGLTRYLLEIARQDINERTRKHLEVMLRLVNELESVTDGCFSLAVLLERAEKKELKLDKDELKRLTPYALLVGRLPALHPRQDQLAARRRGTRDGRRLRESDRRLPRRAQEAGAQTAQDRRRGARRAALHRPGPPHREDRRQCLHHGRGTPRIEVERSRPDGTTECVGLNIFSSSANIPPVGTGRLGRNHPRPGDRWRGHILFIAFELAGALALFLFGMQLSSEGIQRAAGDRLQRAVNLMTKNSVVATLTGVILTILLQSSSATTVMLVSFVNAGLLNLIQAVGVIMGANIGTTLTGWIVAAVGVKKFSIVALAVPLFGVGYFLSLIKDKKRGDVFKGYGEGLMGFALIFLGLEFMPRPYPIPPPDALLFLQDFAGRGWFAILACVAVRRGIHHAHQRLQRHHRHSHRLAAKGVINFEMAAAITLGANIGTTFDSFLVSLAPT
jgi:Na/Pi-cotransporter